MLKLLAVAVACVALASCVRHDPPFTIPTLAEATPIPAPQGTAVPSVLLLELGSEVSRQKETVLFGGEQCSTGVRYSGFDPPVRGKAAIDFGRTFVEVMESQGYPAKALVVEQFAGNDDRLRLQGIFLDVAANLCNEGAGQVYVEIAWILWDSRTEEAVFRTTTEGTTTSSSQNLEEYFAIFMEGFSDAVRNLLADPAYLQTLLRFAETRS